MSYFPLFIDISKKKVLVAGGGVIASRRVSVLVSFQAEVTVVAPHVSDGIQSLSQQGKIAVIRRKFRTEDVEGYDIVIACTDSRSVNAEAEKAARQSGILFNRADQKERCDFYFPAVVQWDDMTAGVCSSGKNPKKTKEICAKIRDIFSLEYEEE